MSNLRKSRPGRVIEGGALYLLRLDSSLFYLRTAGDGKPLGVCAPSAAAHLSYAEADRLCQQFRAMGYTGPVVVDIYGRVIDNEALETERAAQEARAREFWGEAAVGK